MHFKFKNQAFQAQAADSVCDLFTGQPLQTQNFSLNRLDELSIGSNQKISLSESKILENLRAIQLRNNIQPSESLCGMNFSVEMETGVGKTYSYIKTVYELNKRYGWSKFIVVVPSVAVREGVKKSFEMTEDHFAEIYSKKIRHFVYNSKNLSVIKNFVSDSKIWAMIINVQAFNARSADARRMLQPLDDFQSQIPIEIIAKINPIVIIDEPQSVEGSVASEKIKNFNPLMILRYSATHKNIFNLVYRLDALDAYNQRLVKKISVKGIEKCVGNAAGYIFFEKLNLSKQNPTATLTFNRKISAGTKKITRKISTDDDLFILSGGLDDYRNFKVTLIDGAEKSVEFINGIKIFVGQVIGDVDEDEFRRIQIRETIQSHLEREYQLFQHGIKVLSLFFIDEVAKYRKYDGNNPVAGVYAKIFEEEYISAVQNFKADADYKNYLDPIAAQDTHAGYFSIDKKNRATNSKDDDADAYNLIMRDKEQLLDLKNPVRFIFSHSALKEGWDNPNVFQICTLKQTSSDIRRRQEVGRGMRLSINSRGERMDVEKIGADVHNINILTVIANESYKNFADGLQKEFSEVCAAADKIKIENARDIDVEATADDKKLRDKNFLELWAKISQKSFYSVEFDSEELIKGAISALNNKLSAPKSYFIIERGTLNYELTFDKENICTEAFQTTETAVEIDLIAELAKETDLTRRDIAKIIKSIEFVKINHEKFIPNTKKIILDAKSAQVTANISYTALDERFNIKIFNAPIKGRLNVNATPTEKNIYDYLIFDSDIEKKFAAELEKADGVLIYVKLPSSFYIPTPLGKYNPDWAIVFREGDVKNIYFVVETKGSDAETQLRGSELGKIECAKKFFDIIGGGKVKYLVTDSFYKLLEAIK